VRKRVVETERERKREREREGGIRVRRKREREQQYKVTGGEWLRKWLVVSEDCGLSWLFWSVWERFGGVHG
jgi:hypothetical protein